MRPTSHGANKTTPGGRYRSGDMKLGPVTPAWTLNGASGGFTAAQLRPESDNVACHDDRVGAGRVDIAQHGAQREQVGVNVGHDGDPASSHAPATPQRRR